jgi:alkylated DNA repair dioxygenase AlkB
VKAKALVPQGLADSVVAGVTAALRQVDLDALRDTYWRQNEFVYLERCLPLPLVERFGAEVEDVRSAVHRVRVPGKKSGSVGYHTLRERAPAIVTLYHTPALLDFLVALTGRPLMRCPERDPHACALYLYTEPGDYITPHYDTSFYAGARYTVLLGLINRTRSRLACQLFRGDAQREPVDLELATEPGTVVVFNGDKLWHSITPLGAGEERVSLTMEFVTTQAMTPFKRFVSDMKDAISYFGFREVFGG